MSFTHKHSHYVCLFMLTFNLRQWLKPLKKAIKLLYIARFLLDFIILIGIYKNKV
jgi:hypothetical protein